MGLRVSAGGSAGLQAGDAGIPLLTERPTKRKELSFLVGLRVSAGECGLQADDARGIPLQPTVIGELATGNLTPSLFQSTPFSCSGTFYQANHYSLQLLLLPSFSVIARHFKLNNLS